jgi:glycerophosphoryl diester phosphodiesterase
MGVARQVILTGWIELLCKIGRHIYILLSIDIANIEENIKLREKQWKTGTRTRSSRGGAWPTDRTVQVAAESRKALNYWNHANEEKRTQAKDRCNPQLFSYPS